MYKKTIPLVIPLIFMFLAGAQPLLAENGRVMVVLDGSGSMRGRVDGERKILSAKRVLGELIENWDTADHLGLMAYGHRRTRDCSDIEILVPVSEFNASRLQSAVEDVNAKGRTPLSEAVRLAAEALNHETTAGTVILITDGLETCNADPCALGKQLAASGIDFQTHVIGFDLAGKNTTALQCLANETGGLYLDAANASELSEALGKTVSETKVIRNVTLRALDGNEELLTQAVMWNVYMQAGKGIGERQHIGLTAEYSVALELGEYLATAKVGDFERRQAFTVETTDPMNVDVVMAHARIELDAKLSSGSKPLRRVLGWTVFTINSDGSRGTRVATDPGSSVRFNVPPGDYIGVVDSEDLEIEFQLNLKAGDNGARTIDLGAGLLRVEAVGTDGAPTKGHAGWSLYIGNSSKGTRPVAREVRRSTTFMVAAGDYIVRGDYKGERIEEKITVPLGGEISHTVVFSN